MRGSKVCMKHGGKAPQVREAARRRLELLVEPAIGTLRREMLRGDSSTVRLRAAESILDRAGIVAEQQVQVDNQVTIRVEYADVITEAKAVVEGEVLAVNYVPELPPPSENGADNGSSA
jgi:HEAT repeat protein